jgi:hypothetical protein
MMNNSYRIVIFLSNRIIHTRHTTGLIEDNTIYFRHHIGKAFDEDRAVKAAIKETFATTGRRTNGVGILRSLAPVGLESEHGPMI